MNLREAAQAALEALDWMPTEDETVHLWNRQQPALRALRAALAAEPAQTAAVDAAVAAERERCAKLCERQAQLQIATGADDGVIAQAHRCAMVIRREKP